ncbi:MAG: hypothetical protein HC838_12175 [Spirulinaceae cyanobacterium RM2_2_10]|nr:hypothetical protein [Spirulinaceae cyanobacterium SM2_1_0]NJO20634.1 hypothetical protein [Spirulinaceae cyanobacterium RM2_2_10]
MSHDILNNYLDAVEQNLLALSNAYVEQFSATILTPERANLKLRIRFQGQYLLAISEALLVADGRVSYLDYRYHCQNEKNELIFRYDSTPHFPNLPSFPHHKHLPDTVIATDKPDLAQVLQEASDLVTPND